MKRHIIVKLMVVMMVVLLTSMQVFAAPKTTEFFDGALSVKDSAGTGKGDVAEYTITVKSIGFEATNNVTIKNESDVAAKISFGYSVSNHNKFTLEEETVSDSGAFSRVVEPKEEVNISFSTKAAAFSQKTATLTLTDITYSRLESSSEITYMFDSSQCAVTVGGVAISSGSTITVEEAGAEIVATPIDGWVFVGWVKDNGEIVSRTATYEQKPDGDKTVTALFSKATPYFMVDDKYIFSDLNAAAKSGKTIVLLCDGVLEEGEYEIPSTATLLIPFDDLNTLYTNKPGCVNVSWSKPSAYRTLIMAEGAEIKVLGAISVSAKQTAKQGYNGSPVGKYGHIAMEKGSSITIESGGNLYAWGFITGSGEITAKSSSTVYEDFQVTDWRGGSATTEMLNNKQRVFPMSQYYVQNIEVPLTLEWGAVENGYMSVYVTLVDVQESVVPFIGPNGMFKIESGSITKDYDETTDRLVISVNGTLRMSPLSISMKLSLIGEKTINSANYTLPINGNITLNINNGSEVYASQELALLPGGVINVYEGAKCIFETGAKVFVYDKDQWGNYCSHKNKALIPVNFAPGKAEGVVRTAEKLLDAEVYVKGGEVDATKGSVFVTESGANVHGADGGIVRLKVDKTVDKTYQVTYISEDNPDSYNEIPVTTAKLRCSDGTYVDPEVLGDCCSAYRISDGKWVPEAVNHLDVVIDKEAVEPTCTEEGQTEGSHCAQCNTVLNESQAIPVLGHGFSTEWTVDSEPDCTKEGSKSHHCLRCSEVADVTVIDALGHNFDGLTCLVCGCEKIITNTKYSISDGKIVINTSLISDMPADTQIMIAIYGDSGQFLGVALHTAASLKETTLSAAGVEMIKVFAWDGLDALMPISGVEEIEV